MRSALLAVAVVAVIAALLFLYFESRGDRRGDGRAMPARDAGAPAPAPTEPPTEAAVPEGTLPPGAPTLPSDVPPAQTSEPVTADEQARFDEIAEATLEPTRGCLPDGAAGALEYQIEVVNEGGTVRVESLHLTATTVAPEVRACIVRAMESATWTTELGYERASFSHELDLADLAPPP